MDGCPRLHGAFLAGLFAPPDGRTRLSGQRGANLDGRTVGSAARNENKKKGAPCFLLLMISLVIGDFEAAVDLLQQ